MIYSELIISSKLVMTSFILTKKQNYDLLVRGLESNKQSIFNSDNFVISCISIEEL